MKKRTRKTTEYAVITLIIAAAAVFTVRFISLSPKDKKQQKEPDKTITVELTIDFSTVYNDDNYAKLSEAHKTSSDLPESGYFVKNETVTVGENSNVLDALIACCEQSPVVRYKADGVLLYFACVDFFHKYAPLNIKLGGELNRRLKIILPNSWVLLL